MENRTFIINTKELDDLDLDYFIQNITKSFKIPLKFMERKKYTQDEKYKMVLHSFYVLRSEIKFKNHELNLCEDKKTVILKDLKTDKEYKLSIWDTMYVDASEFISRAKQENDDIFLHL